ncbi:RagB/SusD family nutrient uptake outer membrane protein [Flavobacterium ardleyense]|uniref:RagB/SusD family nutrient uptake outer membrane protein n=1 Tax=Flavobacterium ardleyense TaxID=2038737 RepID=A0ABW5ZCZ9_9FLAO
MKKIVLLFTVIFAFYSCEDSLDRLPNDSLVSDTAYRTVDDLELGLNGVFSAYTQRNIITFSSIFTDESKIGADNGGQQINLYNQVLDPAEGSAAAIWAGHYSAIARANRIIVAASTITPSAAEQARYDNIVGQCYALRALCHFDLLNHYTVDPRNLTSLAVPYVDRVLTAGIARNTVEEVRDGILDDLDTAQAKVSTTDTYFATGNFFDFLRAKVFLVTGDFPQALIKADAVIANVPLATVAQYPGIFTDANNAEIIFRRKRTVTETYMGGTWFFTGTGGAFMEMSNKMYDALVPNDVRTNVLFDPTSDVANNEHLINKYPGSSGVNYFNQEKVMRVSEMYLVKAEAQARLTSYGPAAQTIKLLRDNRFTSGNEPGLDVYTNMNEAATAILAERNLELGYEGHRYVDIKRLRNDTNVGIVRNALDCGGSVPCTIGVTDHRFTLPVPLNETGANTLMVQNPGYN